MKNAELEQLIGLLKRFKREFLVSDAMHGYADGFIQGSISILRQRREYGIDGPSEDESRLQIEHVKRASP